MAARNLTEFTATAQKGLKEFLQAEDGGTGKRTALSMGLLVGGAVMMQHLAAQPADADHGCLYAQQCPNTDECFVVNQDVWQCPTNACPLERRCALVPLALARERYFQWNCW